VRVTKLAGLALVTIAVTACTSVAPSSTPFISTPVTPVPGASALPSIALPSLPFASIPPETISPGTEAPSAPPTVEPTAPPTPKPTKKPTPSPSPTPTPIAGDIEVAFQDTSIPNPFYNNTDYSITVYISALGTQDLPNVHVKLVAKDEAVSFKFDTGPIAFGGTYTHDVTVNLQAIGPSALILSASMPDGYADTNKANNSKIVPIDVQLAP
jgi:hypothetical protein